MSIAPVMATNTATGAARPAATPRSPGASTDRRRSKPEAAPAMMKTTSPRIDIVADSNTEPRWLSCDLAIAFNVVRQLYA
jgi:hypothetical protein